MSSAAKDALALIETCWPDSESGLRLRTKKHREKYGSIHCIRADRNIGWLGGIRVGATVDRSYSFCMPRGLVSSQQCAVPNVRHSTLGFATIFCCISHSRFIGHFQ